ncbi:hypothetical protein B0T16DRAFT_463295 [Cercophora newfieldiana]|uniref:Uncharacterized protein n=1 Tax=Cercophora newfieldiana TaxID=92897 RepID=A0AA39XV38_9PEZI|nr:hypothetical protein B0T16DRAFT_463295 [Cercophora newfieldiana]
MGGELLNVLKIDFLVDICGIGTGLVSGFNFVSSTALCLSMFLRIEAQLASKRNKLYRRIYEPPCEKQLAPLRLRFAKTAFETRNKECLATMMEAIELSSPELKEHVYWPPFEQFEATEDEVFKTIWGRAWGGQPLTKACDVM